MTRRITNIYVDTSGTRGFHPSVFRYLSYHFVQEKAKVKGGQGRPEATAGQSRPQETNRGRRKPKEFKVSLRFRQIYLYIILKFIKIERGFFLHMYCDDHFAAFPFI